MAGLSLCHDGLTLDSLLDLCGLPAFSSTSSERITEVELRNILDKILNNSSVKNPSLGMVTSGLGFELPSGASSVDSVCVNYSDVLSCLIQKNCKGRGAGDSSYQMLEELVYRIFNEKVAKHQDGDVSYSKGRLLMDCSTISGSFKRKSESLEDMLLWIKGVATDPCDLRTSWTLQEWRKRRNLILRTRKALFLGITYHMNHKEFPYRRKPRIHQFLCGTSRDISCASSLLDQSHDMLNQPIRRSQRSLGLLKFNQSGLLRKRVPVGPAFQADVPIWADSGDHRVLSGEFGKMNDLRWLGTRIWPVNGQNQENTIEMIGKGKTNLCFCSAPGSLACVRLHVSMARCKMKSNLGQVYSSLGFDRMGEEVSESWACEEQMNFEMLVKLNPMLEGKSFWGPALKFFTSKSSQDLASYYFNVFVPRRMSILTRMEYREVDSDDDEGYISALDPLYSQRR